jgi:hypothetical protein
VSYSVEQQEKAEDWYRLKCEYERAQDDRDHAQRTLDDASRRLREAEKCMVEYVGANVPKKLFRIDSGTFVMVQRLSDTYTSITVEPVHYAAEQR